MINMDEQFHKSCFSMLLSLLKKRLNSMKIS